jgi:acyl-CoA thioesterase
LAEIRGAVRFRDRRPLDVLSLAAIADSFPPPAFAWIEPTWVPTLELTLHVRARPQGDWLRCSFRTRFLFGGLLEEDGELWDETGRLVALSRQLAMAPV